MTELPSCRALGVDAVKTLPLPAAVAVSPSQGFTLPWDWDFSTRRLVLFAAPSMVLGLLVNLGRTSNETSVSGAFLLKIVFPWWHNQCSL